MMELKDVLEATQLAVRGAPGGHWADLRGADLPDTDLAGVDLRRANLAGANLARANLSAANLICADMRGADLHGANLANANLESAIMAGANLRSADLSGANLAGAILIGADQFGVRLDGANLIGAVGLPGRDDSLIRSLSMLERARLLYHYRRQSDSEFDWGMFHETYAEGLMPSTLVGLCDELIIGGTGDTPRETVIARFRIPSARTAFYIKKEIEGNSGGEVDWNFTDDPNELVVQWTGGWD